MLICSNINGKYGRWSLRVIKHVEKVGNANSEKRIRMVFELVIDGENCGGGQQVFISMRGSIDIECTHF